MNDKILKYMKDNIFLNKRRYESARNKYVELEDSLMSIGYSAVKIQGSFCIKTAIKPVEETDEYDLDIIVMILGEFTTNDSERFEIARETLFKQVEDIGKQCSWGNFEILNIKKGIRVEFKNELHFDIVPVFDVAEGSINQNYIYNFQEQAVEKSEPFKFTELIQENIDINKRITLMIIKKLIQNSFKDELKILPSIGSAFINTVDIKNNDNFTIPNVIANLEYVIVNKRGILVNPYVSSEEFYTKNGYDKTSWKEYLTALDSLKLTLQKMHKTNDFQFFVEMIEKGKFIESNGITEETGSGGHA